MTKDSADQSHLMHIMALALFLIVMILVNAQEVVNRPSLAVGLGMIYLLVNSLVDIKNQHFSADRVLEYGAIAVLAVVISFSI